MSSPSLLDAAGRRRSPAAMPGHNAGPRQGTRVSCIRLIRRRSMRSSQSCANPTRPSRTPVPSVDRGAVAWRTTNPGSAVADRVRSRPATRFDSDSAAAKATAVARSDSTRGRGTTISLRGSRPGSSCRSVRCLRDRRSDARPAVVTDRRPRRATTVRGAAGVRRRFAPHQLRHAHAVELAAGGRRRCP